MASKAEALPLRASVLIERGNAIAAAFDELGMKMSADVTRDYVSQIRSAPYLSCLYEYQIEQQRERLAGRLGRD